MVRDRLTNIITLGARPPLLLTAKPKLLRLSAGFVIFVAGKTQVVKSAGIEIRSDMSSYS